MGLFRRTKNNNKPLFRQIIDLIPRYLLHSVIQKHQSDKYCSKYKTFDQLVALMFGQLNKCYTLEDISAGLGVSSTYVADLGLKQSPARSTMSEGNRKRSFQVFEALYDKRLKHYERVLEPKHRTRIIEEIKGKNIKVIDSTTVTLCWRLFSWAKYRTAKGGLKIHTCWDEQLMMPEMVNITEAAISDLEGHPKHIFPPNTIVVEDRGYFDCKLFKQRTEANNWFVTRLKRNTVFEVVAQRPLPDDKAHLKVIKDEEIMLTGAQAAKAGVEPYAMRKVVVYDRDNDRFLELITNNFEWSAATVAQLYELRWVIEVFFKAMKQNLQIKTFLGTSENAVKSQIYVALICHLLIELLRRNTCKAHPAFSNFVEKIRICVGFYMSIDRVCNQVCQGAKPVQGKSPPKLFSGQTSSASSKTGALPLLFR